MHKPSILADAKLAQRAFFLPAGEKIHCPFPFKGKVRMGMGLGRTVMVGFMAGALLAGCSLAPDYQRPDAPVAAQWTQATQADGKRQADALAWRTFFPDPRLQELIAAALDHNR
ncbi:MAG: hypothetical protein ABFE02_07940, partial [Sulfuricella sp.]